MSAGDPMPGSDCVDIAALDELLSGHAAVTHHRWSGGKLHVRVESEIGWNGRLGEYTVEEMRRLGVRFHSTGSIGRRWVTLVFERRDGP